jgi:hypothetical protein
LKPQRLDLVAKAVFPDYALGSRLYGLAHSPAQGSRDEYSYWRAHHLRRHHIGIVSRQYAADRWRAKQIVQIIVILIGIISLLKYLAVF